MRTTNLSSSSSPSVARALMLLGLWPARRLRGSGSRRCWCCSSWECSAAPAAASIEFDDVDVAQAVGVVARTFSLVAGGLDTEWGFASVKRPRPGHPGAVTETRKDEPTWPR